MRPSSEASGTPSIAWTPWAVDRAAAETASPPSWLDRLFRRNPPSIYQRCLAMHIAAASLSSELH
jgi:hypothetical protein